MKPEVEQKSMSAVIDDVEGKKALKCDAGTENSTPEKKEMDVEEQKVQTDLAEKRTRRKRVPKESMVK